MSLIDFSEQHQLNPLDVVEHVAGTNNWSFERASDEEITLLVGGRWTDYQVSFTWMSAIESLHLACAFDFKVPERRRAEVQQLISHINEQMWVGHFDLWLARRHGDVPPCATCSPAARKHPTSNAKRCLRRRSRHASAISPPFSSSSGPASRHARRSTRRCSRRRARPSLDKPTARMFMGGLWPSGSRTICMTTNPAAGTLAGLPGRLVLVGAGKMGGAMLESWLALGLDGRQHRGAGAAAVRRADGFGRPWTRAQSARQAAVDRRGRDRDCGEAAGASGCGPRALPPLIGANTRRPLDHGRHDTTLPRAEPAGRHRLRARDAEYSRCDRPRHHRRGGEPAGHRRPARAGRQAPGRDRRGRMGGRRER